MQECGYFSSYFGYYESEKRKYKSYSDLFQRASNSYQSNTSALLRTPTV